MEKSCKTCRYYKKEDSYYRCAECMGTEMYINWEPKEPERSCKTCGNINCSARGIGDCTKVDECWRPNSQDGIPGVGPEAEIVANELGGKQSATPYAFDCLDPGAMFAMCKVLEEGRTKYGKDNWRKIPAIDNANHLLMHIFAWMAGDKSDDHLSHILCRAMFLYATAQNKPIDNAK